MTTAKRDRLTIILNRESGTLRKLGADLVTAELNKILLRLGCQADIRTVVGDEIEAAVEAACRADPGAVIVGGGDGSVATAASVCARHGIPMGILPLGTFNLAARDVGSSVEWQEAAELLVSAPVAEMDLLDVDGKVCLCVVVLGFYPSFAMGRPEYHGNWMVKTFRTILDSLLHAATFPPLHLRLANGDSIQTYRTRMVLIANNDYEDIFGIIPSRQSLDAGYFTVYISKHTSQLGLMKAAVAWLFGRWKQDREITVLRATELHIDVKRKRRIAVMMDGEIERMSLPFTVTLLPKALRIIAPRFLETALPPPER